MNERRNSEASGFGVEAARELFKARRLTVTATGTLAGWVIGTAILNRVAGAPLPVWIITSAVTIVVVVPFYIWSLIAAERMRKTAARLAGSYLGYRVDGQVASVPRWLLRLSPEGVTRAMAEQASASVELPNREQSRVAELRAAVSRRAWALSVCGAFLLAIGVVVSLVALVLAVVSAFEPQPVSPVVLLGVALVFYIFGFPMLLAFARDAKHHAKPSPPSDV